MISSGNIGRQIFSETVWTVFLIFYSALSLIASFQWYLKDLFNLKTKTMRKAIYRKLVVM